MARQANREDNNKPPAVLFKTLQNRICQQLPVIDVQSSWKCLNNAEDIDWASSELDNSSTHRWFAELLGDLFLHHWCCWANGLWGIPQSNLPGQAGDDVISVMSKSTKATVKQYLMVRVIINGLRADQRHSGGGCEDNSSSSYKNIKQSLGIGTNRWWTIISETNQDGWMTRKGQHDNSNDCCLV